MQAIHVKFRKFKEVGNIAVSMSHLGILWVASRFFWGGGLLGQQPPRLTVVPTLY